VRPNPPTRGATTVEGWPSKTVKEVLEEAWSLMAAAVKAIIKTSESLLVSFPAL
jgi:hypothetical protein